MFSTMSCIAVSVAMQCNLMAASCKIGMPVCPYCAFRDFVLVKIVC